MGERNMPVRVIGVVAGVFVLLAAIQIWLHQAEQSEPGDNQPSFSPTEIEGKGQKINIGGGEGSPTGASPELDRLTREKIRRLRNGSVSERRRAALQLTFNPHPAAEEALLDGLDDPERQVAEQCSQALLEVWRSSDSAVAGLLLERALEAYETGRWDAALRQLNDTSRLDPDISEVYRLKARIWIRRGKPDKALKNAQKAISLQEKHFRAHYLAARSYAEKGQVEKGKEQLKEALAIYPAFEEAMKLKEKLDSGAVTAANGD